MELKRYGIIDPDINTVVTVIEYYSQPTTPIPGLNPSWFAIQNDLVDIGWTYSDGKLSPPPAPPKPIPTSDENKTTAIGLLSATDWVNEPDVYDINSTPHLLNRQDFLTYRNQLRQIAVNPVAGDIQWPVKPTEQWSD